MGLTSLGAMVVETMPTGCATGLGSLPGEDIDAAVAVVFDDLPDLPYLPELPARGPGAQMIGRTATHLVGLAVDLQPAGWRLVDRGGIDRQRGRDLMTADLDALMPVAGPGYDGRLKVQLAGPWTLAAALSVPRGGPALGDRGATRDLAESLAETIREHLAEVARRLPRAALVLQLDEPSLPAVLAGRVATESGFGALRAPDARVAIEALATAVAGAGDVPVVVHCCAPQPPVTMLREAGAAAVSIDVLTQTPPRDALAELVESGAALWLGVLESLGPGVPPSPRSVADPVRALWRELGFPAEQLADTVTLTPTCGLAGASPGWVRTAHRLVRQAARALAEAPEGTRR